jgi:hypothetical protein
VTFIQQGGRNRHEHICESLELFAREVMPEFHEEEAERQRKKDAELAPFIAAAMKRKQYMRALSDDEIPVMQALGRQIAETQSLQRDGSGGGIPIPVEDPAARR